MLENIEYFNKSVITILNVEPTKLKFSVPEIEFAALGIEQ